MAAMTTVSSIARQLTADYPAYNFRKGKIFSWSPHHKQITYINKNSQENIAQLLHETAHAILEHHSYLRDIALLDIERQAWNYAIQYLALHYHIQLNFTDDIVQNSLDSYRIWLHQRSICPNCQAVGLEIAKLHYRCLHCQKQWRVNEARTCELRHYKT